MPSPRFERAAPELRARVLEAVQAAAERGGLDKVALLPVLADAGLSRSAGYTYFDGRDELVDWAIDETVRHATDVVGEWQPVADDAAFWAALSDAAARLRAHVSGRPARGILLAAATSPRRDDRPRPDPTTWLTAAFADARRLGLVTSPLDPRVLERVTVAAVVALDELELAEAGQVSNDDIAAVLRSLWSASAR